MNKIIELLTGNVACEETALASFRLAMIMAMRNGKTEEFEKQLENQSAVRAVAFAPGDATAMVNTVDQWDIGDPNLPENSVALLYFEGMAYPWKSFDMENRIARREEWMAAKTMIGNGCVMQEYIDGATKGGSLVGKFSKSNI